MSSYYNSVYLRNVRWSNGDCILIHLTSRKVDLNHGLFVILLVVFYATPNVTKLMRTNLMPKISKLLYRPTADIIYFVTTLIHAHYCNILIINHNNYHNKFCFPIKPWEQFCRTCALCLWFLIRFKFEKYMNMKVKGFKITFLYEWVWIQTVVHNVIFVCSLLVT